jgi:hypothetical protein
MKIIGLTCWTSFIVSFMTLKRGGAKKVALRRGNGLAYGKSKPVGYFRSLVQLLAMLAS